MIKLVMRTSGLDNTAFLSAQKPSLIDRPL